MSDMILRTSFGQTAQFRRATATMGRPAWTPFALFNAGQAGEWRDANPSRNFRDPSASVPPSLGIEIAHTRDVRGAAFGHDLQATLALRPIYGRHPRGGIRNRANGAASGSTTYWHNGTVTAGLTVTIVGYGIAADGEAFHDIRLAGTSNSNETRSLYREEFSRHRPASGVAYRSSATVQFLTAQAGVTIRLSILQPGSGITTINSATTSATTETPLGVTWTNANANFDISTWFQAIFPVGVPVDVTIRVKGLQFEQGTARTAYQANFGPFDITEPGVPDTPYRQGTLGGKLMLSSAPLDLSGQDTVSFWMVAEKFSDVDAFTMLAHGTPSTSGAVWLGKAATNAQWTAFYRNPGATVAISRGAAVAPQRAVLSGLITRGTGSVMRLFWNGLEVSPVTTELTAPFLNAVVARFARADGSQPFNGRIYEDAIRAGAFTDQQFALLNSYLMTEYGVAA